MNNTSHPLYTTWAGMRSRCNNPNHPAFKRYGGRGITVCDRWNNFWSFVEDMGPRPDGYTIERTDNDGNYEPSNCCWASPKSQASNRRLRSVVNDNPMNCIRVRHDGYRVAIRLMPNTIQHFKFFTSLEDAKEYRDLCDYERVFHRILLSKKHKQAA